MIHSQHAIEVTILLVAEKSVGCIWAKCHHLVFHSLVDCWDYHLLLFLAEQTAVAGGFDKAAAIMTCHTTTGNLPFKQLCAFVRITTESATKKIVFKTNGTESLAGTLSVAIAGAGADEGTGTATVTANGSSAVSLVPASGETSIAAGTYLIAVLPGTLT